MTTARFALTRSRLGEMRAPERFGWATGIEDTFITDPWPATRRTLDEYELTDHYRRWRSDIALMRDLGVRMARYGIPWYRINPGPGRWQWKWADKPLERMLELGIDPIVDLVHYGTPAWITGGFLDTSFPERMAEYAARVAERFRGSVYWYTPFNEPRIAAWYCGRIGWWPPYQRGWRGFVAVLLQICRGVALSDAALRAVDEEIVPLHVDATDLYATDEPALAAEAARRQEIVFLALDLVTGAFAEDHALRAWLAGHGVSDAALEWFSSRRVALDVVGINMYPMFTVKRLLRSARGMRIRMVWGGPEMVERLCAMYAARYDRPVMITETAALGSARRRCSWLDSSISAVARVRARGIPVVGYTWWPMFSLVAWSYRQSDRALERYLLRMGLWDLDASQRLARVRTPVADAYRAVVENGASIVGPVGAPTSSERPRARSARSR